MEEKSKNNNTSSKRTKILQKGAKKQRKKKVSKKRDREIFKIQELTELGIPDPLETSPEEFFEICREMESSNKMLNSLRTVYSMNCTNLNLIYLFLQFCNDYTEKNKNNNRLYSYCNHFKPGIVKKYIKIFEENKNLYFLDFFLMKGYQKTNNMSTSAEKIHDKFVKNLFENTNDMRIKILLISFYIDEYFRRQKDNRNKHLKQNELLFFFEKIVKKFKKIKDDSLVEITDDVYNKTYEIYSLLSLRNYDIRYFQFYSISWKFSEIFGVESKENTTILYLVWMLLVRELYNDTIMGLRAMTKNGKNTSAWKDYYKFEAYFLTMFKYESISLFKTKAGKKPFNEIFEFNEENKNFLKEIIKEGKGDRRLESLFNYYFRVKKGKKEYARLTETYEFYDVWYNCIEEDESISTLPFVNFCLFYDFEKINFEKFQKIKSRTIKEVSQFEDEEEWNYHILGKIMKEDYDYSYSTNENYQIFSGVNFNLGENLSNPNHVFGNNRNYAEFMPPIQTHLSKINHKSENEPFYYLRAHFPQFQNKNQYLKITPIEDFPEICSSENLIEKDLKKYKIYFPKELIFLTPAQNYGLDTRSFNHSNSHPYPYVWNYLRVLPFNNLTFIKMHLYESLQKDKFKNFDKDFSFFYRHKSVSDLSAYQNQNQNHPNRFINRFHINVEKDSKTLIKIKNKSRKILFRYQLVKSKKIEDQPNLYRYIQPQPQPIYFLKTRLQNGNLEEFLIKVPKNYGGNYLGLPYWANKIYEYEIIPIKRRDRKYKKLFLPQELRDIDFPSCFDPKTQNWGYYNWRRRHRFNNTQSKLHFESPFVIAQFPSTVNFYKLWLRGDGNYGLKLFFKVPIPGILSHADYVLEFHELSEEKICFSLDEPGKYEKSSKIDKNCFHNLQFKLLIFTVDFLKKKVRFVKSFQGPGREQNNANYLGVKGQKMVSILDCDDEEKIEFCYSLCRRSDLEGNMTIQVMDFVNY